MRRRHHSAWARAPPSILLLFSALHCAYFLLPGEPGSSIGVGFGGSAPGRAAFRGRSAGGQLRPGRCGAGLHRLPYKLREIALKREDTAGGARWGAEAQVSGVESTPSPDAFKFTLDCNDEKEADAATVYTMEETELLRKGKTFRASDPFDKLVAPGPLKKLLETPGIHSLYAMPDWVTITKESSVSWESLLDVSIEILGGKASGLELPKLTLEVSQKNEGGESPAAEDDLEGYKVRLQSSNGIPIQLEAASMTQTRRMKLSDRFERAISTFLSQPGNDQLFFQNRKWVNRGTRYGATNIEECLQTVAKEIEDMYPQSRLDSLVAKSGQSEGLIGNVATGGDATLSDIDSVAHIAETHDKIETRTKALETIMSFVRKGGGSTSVRRHAIALLGLMGDKAVEDSTMESMVECLSFCFVNEQTPFLRRTAGDALNDLGDPRGVPAAVKALKDTSKLVRWRAAHILGEIRGDEIDGVISKLSAAREVESAYEVAFEMASSENRLRKQVEVQQPGIDIVEDIVKGPMWKQIQAAAVKDNDK